MEETGFDTFKIKAVDLHKEHLDSRGITLAEWLGDPTHIYVGNQNPYVNPPLKKSVFANPYRTVTVKKKEKANAKQTKLNFVKHKEGKRKSEISTDQPIKRSKYWN